MAVGVMWDVLVLLLSDLLEAGEVGRGPDLECAAARLFDIVPATASKSEEDVEVRMRSVQSWVKEGGRIDIRRQRR